MRKFSIKEAIGFGWKTFKKNWKFLLIVSLIPIAISVFSWIGQKNGNGLLTFIWAGIFWLISLIVSIGIVKIYLILAQGGKPRFSELYSNHRFFLNYLIGSFLYSLVVFVGLILLVIPGIIFAIRLSFWKYILIDQNMGPDKALKESWRITRGNILKLFAFKIVQSLINVLGILALGVGVLVSGSVSSLAEVFVYKKLSSKP